MTMNNILSQARRNKGVVIIDGVNWYTRRYLRDKFEVSGNTILYYQKHGIVPEPLKVTTGEGEMYIYLWSEEDLVTIKKNKSRLSFGRYKNNRHPVTSNRV